MPIKKLADAETRRWRQDKHLDFTSGWKPEWNSSIKRRSEMTDAEKAEAKQRVLSQTWWGNLASLSMHGIGIEEKINAHLANPVVIERASDWIIHPMKSASIMRPSYERWALHCHANGWNIFPETARGDRKPALLKKVQIRPGEFYDRPRTRLELASDYLSGEADHHNVAVAIGAGSGHIRVLDIDTLDQDLAEALHAAADEILGETPFVRVGRWPKRQLYYRCAADDEQMLSVPTIALKEFLGADGEIDRDENGSVRNGVEFLAARRNATLYGLHHGTGKSFDWSLGSLHPAIAGPEHAPVITKAQLLSFFERANEIRPFRQNSKAVGSDPRGTGGGMVFSYEKAGDLWLPRVTDGDWVVEDGVVVDGRERFLQHSVWAICAANVEHLAANADEVRFAGRAWAEQACSGRELKGHSVGKEFEVKFVAASQKWRSSIRHYEETGEWLGGMRPYILTGDGRKANDTLVASAPRPADGTLDFLPTPKPIVVAELAEKSKTKGLIRVEQSSEEIAANSAERALLDDEVARKAEHARVDREMTAAIERIFSGVDAYRAQPAGMPPAYILSTPTGSGKTVKTIAAVGNWCRDNPRGRDEGPVIMCLPTHENMAEALMKAEAMGMIVPDPELTIESAQEELETSGVKVVTFKGKIAAGCKRPNELKALEDRQISAAGLCGAEIVTDSEIEARRKRRNGEKLAREEVLCEYRERGECGYFRQHVEVMTADVVLVAHNYLTSNSLPKVLKNARIVIVDESITFRMLHQRILPLDVLDIERMAPFLTKKEEAEGVDAEVLREMRNAAADVAAKAIAKGEDPATAIAQAGIWDHVDAAIKVCMRGHGDDRQINPNLTADDVAGIVAKRTTPTDLIGEEKFWRLVADRSAAKGDIDRRLQPIWIDGKTDRDGKRLAVRMSWRSESNWADAPLVLLDASASPAIIGKVFDRPVAKEKVTAKMHLRTVAIMDHSAANSQFAPRPGASPEQKATAKAARRKVRLLADKVGTVFGHSRLLVGSTTAVQLALQATKGERWDVLPNTDWKHFGALRGLDFAKDHAVAMSVGRSEQPIRVIDGYVAALTYDDEKPQEPYDRMGNELDASGKPLMRKLVERRIRMRSGVDYDHMVMSFPEECTWANEIEAQWREEELRQFVGRLRSVYRNGNPGVYISVGKIIPDGIIVDEIVNLDDLLADADFFRVVRAGGGVMDEHIVPQLPIAAKVLGDRDFRELTDKFFADDKYRKVLTTTMWTVHYISGGQRRPARVMGYHDDPVAALRAAAEKAGVVIDEIISVVEPERRGNAVPAKPDWVAEEVETRRAVQLSEELEAIRETIPPYFLTLPVLGGASLEKLVVDELPEEKVRLAATIDSAREHGEIIEAKVWGYGVLQIPPQHWEQQMRDLSTRFLADVEGGTPPDDAFEPICRFCEDLADRVEREEIKLAA